jgi:hypothetical protein
MRLRPVTFQPRGTSNLWLLFQVRTCGADSRPVTELEGRDKEFELREDGCKISVYESQQTILPHQIGAKMYALLLLDLSGSVQKSGQLATLQSRAREFVRRMVSNMEVAVAAFDGSPEIHELTGYTSDPARLKAAIDGLSSWKEKDPSTNLYGAYIRGFAHLEAKLGSVADQISRGALVIVTDGTDQAGRYTEAQAERVGARYVATEKYSAYAIGVGGEIDCKTLEKLAQGGRSYCYRGRGWQEFDAGAIERIARGIEEEGRSYHVLSYCSPKRAGKHRVALRVAPGVARTEPGPITFEFDATGFGPGCDADAVLQDERIVRCGAPRSAPCDEGYTCRRYRCVSEAELAQEQRDRAAAERERRMAYEQEREAVERSYRGCQAQREVAGREWAAYRPRLAAYQAADCGFRLRLEGGLRLVPAPDGVAGAVLLGWAFPRWAELALGVGFWPAAMIFETRIKPWTWRWLDLLVVPRLAVGLMTTPWTLEAEVLLGLRARLGRHFALYAQLGPGYGRSHWGALRRERFILPGWLGAEFRF